VLQPVLTVIIHNIIRAAIIAMSIPFCYGQVAEKIPTKLLNGPDGIAIDSDGNLLVANWGKKGDGTTIVKISPKGEESVFLDKLQAPDGLTFDHLGTLYISCFGSGEIIKITGNKSPEVIARGLDHPSDLKFDPKGNLYVSSFGNFDGTKVYRIKPDHTVEVFLDSLKIPLGLAFRRNVLYVSSFGDSKVFSVDANKRRNVYAQLPSHTPGYFQYLAFDESDNLYCPSYGHNTIYRISPAGFVQQLQLSDPQGNPVVLNGPNSILIVNNTLYFTEFNTDSIYRVRLK
jgi:sugar lactone lactonase YvrE